MYLWDRRGNGTVKIDPVHRFDGHRDQVKEFVWRSRGGHDTSVDDREFQLVTWSKDQTLRLWPIEEATLRATGHNSVLPIRFPQTRRGAKYMSYRTEQSTGSTDCNMDAAVSNPESKSFPERRNRVAFVGQYMRKPSKALPQCSPVVWMRGVRLGKVGTLETEAPSMWVPECLGEEFPSIETSFPRVKFEEASVSQRTCIVTLNGPWAYDAAITFIRAKLAFPAQYPVAAMPSFEIEKTVDISEETHTKMLSELETIALKHLSRKKPCIEAIVRYLLGEIIMTDELHFDELEDGHVGHDDNEEENSSIGSSGDDDLDCLFPFKGNATGDSAQTTPMPRYCGGVFSGSILACFFAKPEDNKNREKPPKIVDVAPMKQRLFPSFGHLRTQYEELGAGESDEKSVNDFLPPSMSQTSNMSQNRYPKVFRAPAASSERNSNRKNSSQRCGRGYEVIKLKDLGDLMCIKKELACAWVVGSSEADCHHNAMTSKTLGSFDNADLWQLAAHLLRSSSVSEGKEAKAEMELFDADNSTLYEANYNLEHSGLVEAT